MRRKLVPITVETWTKSSKGKYGNTKAELVITPTREGYRLISTIWFDGKRDGKPDVFTETNEQVEHRREMLKGDNYKLTTKQVKVPADEAPRGISESEIAERQYREEIEQMLRPVRRNGGS